MRLLVLGGTAFVGRHIVAGALDRGHDITILTRGVTNPDLFPEVEHLVGDRVDDLAALLGTRTFDAVIDTCGYVPRVVRTSVELLADRVETYVYISTISVYEDAPSVDEGSPTRRPADPSSEDVAAEYGGLKALCELEVEAVLPERSLIIRPGLVVGPYDYTERFTYWPRRLRRGGEVLAPGPPDARVWFIDGRDLADFVVTMVEQGARGTYNAVGPPEPLSLGSLLDECMTAAGTDARITWVSEEFLLAHEVAPFVDLPLWIPASEGGHPAVDIRSATEAGITFRPVAATIRDLLAEDAGSVGTPSTSGPPRPPVGLSPGRERALLEAWHASS